MVGFSQPSCFSADSSSTQLAAQSEPVLLDKSYKQEEKAIEHEAWQQATQAGKQDLLAGDLEGAKTWLKKAYEIAQRFGLNDSRVAVSQSNLGQLYKAQGNYLLAEKIKLTKITLMMMFFLNYSF
jgi:tetratricopeptide (TPR) repeat protein